MLAGTSGGHLDQLSLHKQGHLQQVARDCVQPGFENLCR